MRRFTTIEAGAEDSTNRILAADPWCTVSVAMRVGLGLPNGIPGTDGSLLVEWARRAEEGPFTSVGVIERLAYDCHDPMAALAAAAAVTARVRLVTMAVVGPLRNTALLAKEAATIDAISTGRLVLGLVVGARASDYEAAGVDTRGRGDLFEEQLAALRDAWEKGPGPRPSRPEGPELLVGGTSDVAFARMARFADGYVHGGGPPRAFARAAENARAAWTHAGRPGAPSLWGQSYFALGDEATIERGMDYMRDYYAFTGPFAEKIAAGLLTTPQAIAQHLRGYQEAGCDELVLLPAVAGPEQAERLADVLSDS
jgi:alkanesulfonate monooxygenase SsuD/methylene tetrahydromethanopterin reductase-like flavin-dependent oxidoreductase (luciferase family)